MRLLPILVILALPLSLGAQSLLVTGSGSATWYGAPLTITFTATVDTSALTGSGYEGDAGTLSTLTLNSASSITLGSTVFSIANVGIGYTFVDGALFAVSVGGDDPYSMAGGTDDFSFHYYYLNTTPASDFSQSAATEGSVDSFAPDSAALSVSAIPEPSTYAAIFGAGALGLVVLRRRRQA